MSHQSQTGGVPEKSWTVFGPCHNPQKVNFNTHVGLALEQDRTNLTNKSNLTTRMSEGKQAESKANSWVMMLYAFVSSTLEAGSGGSLSSRQAWSTQRAFQDSQGYRQKACQQNKTPK